MASRTCGGAWREAERLPLMVFLQRLCYVSDDNDRQRENMNKATGKNTVARF